MTLVSRTKPDRNRIDLSDEAIARQWVKQLGRPREDIEAAIEKVGDNCETVRKELGLQAEAHPSDKTAVKTSA